MLRKKHKILEIMIPNDRKEWKKQIEYVYVDISAEKLPWKIAIHFY